MVALTRVLLAAVLVLVLPASALAQGGVTVNGLPVALSDGIPINPDQNIVSQPGASISIRNATAVAISVIVKDADGNEVATLDIPAGQGYMGPHGSGEGKYSLCGGESGGTQVKYANLCIIEPNDSVARLEASGERMGEMRFGDVQRTGSRMDTLRLDSPHFGRSAA